MTVKMVAAYLLTILILIFLTFLLPRLMPDDPIIAMHSGHEVVMTEERYAELVSMYGLDLPLHEQFLTYLSELAHGDLGYSYIYHAPTIDLIMDALPWTLLLMGTAFLLSAVVGIVLGVESSWRRGGRFDRSLLTFMLLLDGFHALVIGIIVLAIFCYHFGWFPGSGATTAYLSTGGIGHIMDVLWHLVLPLATVTLFLIPGDYLLIRNSM
ncbi:MAG: ABC transporter permease, partial [Euryarchaeota archaeon]|nr:ABC transporter permease [Euryarchaeota archaeon]